jgi:hypothetical protein
MNCGIAVERIIPVAQQLSRIAVYDCSCKDNTRSILMRRSSMYIITRSVDRIVSTELDPRRSAKRCAPNTCIVYTQDR